MHALEAIDLDELVTVTGGTEGDPVTPDTTREQNATGNSGVTLRGTQTGLLGG